MQDTTHTVHFTGPMTLNLDDGTISWAVDGLHVTLVGKTVQELDEQLDEMLAAIKADADNTPGCDYLEILRRRGVEVTPSAESTQHNAKRIVHAEAA